MRLERRLERRRVAYARGRGDRADGRWVRHLRNSYAGGAADIWFVYGRWDHFDLPICGDWNGDGVHTPGVVRHAGVTGPLRWLLRNSNTGYGRAELDWPIVWR